jgi:predicted glycoside hydrolase/deacetylase ChbG (UPF0249 family)
MKTIVFNADDLGLSRGVNQGIVEAYKNGVVSSCSLLTNTKYFDETIALIQQHQLINIGLHFNLTEGAPLISTHKSIVDNTGVFFSNIGDHNAIDYSEIALELEAQLNRALSHKIKISHIDSHQHIHTHPKFKSIFLAISKKYEIPIRKMDNPSRNPFKRLQTHLMYRKHLFYTHSFSSAFYDKMVAMATLESIIKESKSDCIEIMCHPGYNDHENGIYNEQRKKELDILTSSELKELLKKIE